VASEVSKPTIKQYSKHLLVCVGPRCTQGESEALFQQLGSRLREQGLDEGSFRVKRTRCSCFAVCKSGPILVVHPDGTWYCNVTLEVFDRILEEHLKGGKPVEEYVFHQAPSPGS